MRTLFLMFLFITPIIVIVPGGIIAFFLDKLPIGWSWLLPVSAAVSVLTTFLFSVLLLNRIATPLHEHAVNTIMMAPFVFLGTLLQLYWLRKGNGSPPR